MLELIHMCFPPLLCAPFVARFEATSSFIRMHKDDPMPSGMTYDMTVTLGMDFPSLDK